MHDESNPQPIHKIVAAVMADVTHVGKEGTNAYYGYRFRGIDSILNHVGPAFRRHGIVPTPHVEHLDIQRVGDQRVAVVTMRYTLTGPAGDSISATVIGEAADKHDKAVSKAQSVAYRTALIQLLCVPTNEPDPDEYSPDLSGPAEQVETTDAPAINSPDGDAGPVVTLTADEAIAAARDIARAGEDDMRAQLEQLWVACRAAGLDASVAEQLTAVVNEELAARGVSA